MHRRSFVRLIGGGVVAAGLGACSSELPSEAVAPWQGPAPDAELRRWAIGHAMLAPNSHNRQPWLVDLREPHTITLHVDRERLLPETDPWFRQIVVSQGAFLELLLIALRERGVDAQVRLFPDGEFAPRGVDDRPVARVTWTTGASEPARDALFAQIPRRHTAKVAYETSRPVSAAHAGTIAATLPVGAPAGLRAGFTLDAAQVQTLRQLCLDAARVEVSTPRTALESARLMRIGPDEIARHRDGISLNDWLPRAALALGLFDRTQAPAPGSRAFDQVMKRFAEHANSAMGFVWITTAAGSRADEVWAGRAFVRQQLKATELGVQMHPLSQAPQEFAEMKPHYEQLHALLGGGGRVVQMLSRIGHCEPQPHAPRRTPDAIIRA